MTLYAPRNRPDGGVGDPLIDFVTTADFMLTHRVLVPPGNMFSIERGFLLETAVEPHATGNIVRLRVPSDGGRTFNRVEVLEQSGCTIRKRSVKKN